MKYRSDPDPVPLEIAVEKVCFLIIKARELDVKEEDTDPDTGSNPTDDGEVTVLEDTADDPVEEELRSLIDDLSIEGADRPRGDLLARARRRQRRLGRDPGPGCRSPQSPYGQLSAR